MPRRIGICFATLLLVSGLCIGRAAAQPTPVKLVEGARNFNVLPVYIAMQEGYFAQEGLQPELITLKGGPAAANALITGDVDLAITLTETVIKLRQQGKDLRVVAVLQDRNPCVIAVPTTSPAKTFADLKGKTIGVTATGSLTDLVLRTYIAEQGLLPSDFKIVAFGQPATVNLALERGEVDAGVTLTPFLTRLELSKTARVIVDFRKDLYPSQSVLVRNEDLAGPKRAMVEKFVRALQKGMAELYDDPGRSSKAARAFFQQMDTDLLEAAIKSDTQEFNLFARTLKVTPEEFEAWQASMVKHKLLPASAPYESVFMRW